MATAVPPESAMRLRHRLRFGWPAIDDGDFGALARESQTAGFANAGAAAGDQYDFVAQSHSVAGTPFGQFS